MPDLGEMQVWTGTTWIKLTAHTTTVSTDGTVTVDGSSSTDKFFPKGGTVTYDGAGGSSFIPDEHIDEETGESVTSDELLEVLLCDECGMELYTEACGPGHAYLADNPTEHRLLKRRVEHLVEQASLRLKNCDTCGGGMVLGFGACPHLDVRPEQVRVSREAWDDMMNRGLMAMTAGVLVDRGGEMASLLYGAALGATPVQLASSKYWSEITTIILHQMITGRLPDPDPAPTFGELVE